MARAIFPATTPSAATLPFLSVGELRNLAGDVIVDQVPCSVWPATSSRSGDAGQHHTHRGEAELDFVEELQQPNRTLVVDGVSYRITSATPNYFLPHVVLELNRTSGRS
jgi:hypothetical protein